MDSTVWVALISFVVGPIVGATVGYLIRRRELVDANNNNAQLSRELERAKKALSLPPMLPPEEYDIRVNTPEEYADVGQSFEVSGTFKELPQGQQIWVSTFRIVRGADGRLRKEYWPQEPATIEITAKGKKWNSLVHNIGGQAGREAKEFLILVVGVDGQALFAYFKNAGNENKSWPSIKELTTDTVECAVGKVTYTSE